MFLFVALSSYFLGALSVILDKFLLGSKRISSPPVYSFYIGFLGLFTAVLIPFFNFYIPSFFQIIVSILGGGMFSVGILFLYFAIQKGEASRVFPIVGAIIPIATYGLSFFATGEKFVLIQITGIFLLIVGGLLISFDLPLKINKRKFASGFWYSLWAGIFLALSYFIFKIVYNEQNFLNGFVWTRIGAFLAILCYFLVPEWRKDIIKSFQGFKKPGKKEYQTGSLFIGNKIIGGVSSILMNFAISLGSVAVLNSLVSSQYVFVLALAYFAHKKYPFVFEEKLKFWDWAQKVGAIILIGIGVAMIY
jgi:drug/metabolite transporter (DMT)-like permease